MAFVISLPGKYYKSITILQFKRFLIWNIFLFKFEIEFRNLKWFLCNWWFLFVFHEFWKFSKDHTQIRNNDPVPIVYRIRTRERSFPRFSTCHGFLEPNEEDEVYVLLPASDYWPRDPIEYAGRRHKVLIENLTVPTDTAKPKDKNEASAISSK